MAEREFAHDPDTGAEWEKVDGRWIRYYGADESVDSSVDAWRIATGDALTRMGRGVGAIATAMNPTYAGVDAGDELRARAARDAGPMGELERDRPIATTVGAVTPALATLPLGMATRGTAAIGEQALLGAAEGAAEIQPGGLRDQFANAAFGGAFAFGSGAASELGARTLARVRAVRDSYQDAVLANQRAPRSGTVTLEGGPSRTTAAAPGAAEQGEAIAEAGADVAAMVTGSTPLVGNSGLERTRLINRARELGMRLTDGDVLNNPQLKQVEAALASTPVTSARRFKQREINQQVLNRQALEAVGVTDPEILARAELSPTVLGDIEESLSQRFDAVGDAVGSLELDQDLFSGLDRVARESERGLGRTNKVAEAVDQFIEEFDGTEIGASKLMEVRSDAVKLLQASSQPDIVGGPRAAAGFSALIREIDDAIVRQAGPEAADDYRAARDAYRVFVTLQRPGVIRNSNVSAPRLVTRLNRDFRHEFRYGREGQHEGSRGLFDAARVVQEFGDIVGDSGTATRLSIQNLVNAPARELISNATQLAGQVAIEGIAEPVGAAAGVLARSQGAAAPEAAGRIGGMAGRVLGNEGRREAQE